MKKATEKVFPINKELAKVIMENIESKPRFYGDHVLSGRPIWLELVLTPHSGFVSCKEIEATVKQLMELGLICKVWHRGCRVLELVKHEVYDFDFESGKVTEKKPWSLMERIERALASQEQEEQEEQEECDFRASLASKLYRWKMDAYHAEGLTQAQISERENMTLNSVEKKSITDDVKAQIEKSKKDYAEKQAKGYSRDGDFHVQDLNPVDFKSLEARVERDLTTIVADGYAREKSLMEERKALDKICNIGITIATGLIGLGIGFIVGYFLTK